MESSDVEWAGVRFAPVHHHDGRFFRQPGLFGLVRRHACGERTLLFVDHADDICSALAGHRLWADALQLGLNELDLNLEARERIDRLILRERIARRCQPVLNLLEDHAEAPADPLSIWPARLRA